MLHRLRLPDSFRIPNSAFTHPSFLQSRMSTLSFDPLISPALWLTLAVLALGLLGWYARGRPSAVPRKRWGLTIGLMAVGAASILAILLNPTWLEPVPPPAGKPLLTILVDRSGSMGVEDLPANKSRWQAAAELAAQAEQDLASRFDVQVRTFADSWSAATAAEVVSARPEGASTNLAAAVAGALAADRPQGQAVLLISDGHDNTPGGVASLLETLRTAKAMDAPVYTTTLGGTSQLRDLEISVLRPQELAFIGQRVPIPVTLRQRGRLTDRADVLLFHEGKEIARETVSVAADGRASLKFNVSQNTNGLYRYEVRVEPGAGEATAVNNTAPFLLRVVGNPVRVLLLEGKPYWDGKFLIRTLAADPSIEVDALVRVTDDRFLLRSLGLDRTATSAARDAAGSEAAETSAAPHVTRLEASSILQEPHTLLEGPEGLATYQLVVLGRDADVFLTSRFLERLRTWISRDGGSLVCYRGTPVAQVPAELARLMPVRWAPSRETRFRVRLTERGSELSWLNAVDPGDEVFGRLPSLATAAPAEQPKPMSVVLARSEAAQGSAVVTYQSYGTGRVVAVEGAGMWRWAFLAPQYQQHDQVYESLWQSLLRWLVSSIGLVPGQDLVLRTDRVTYTTGESVSALLLRRDESSGAKTLEVELIAEDGGAPRKVAAVPLGDEPGVYRVPFGILSEGRYRATVATPESQTEGHSTTTVAFDVRSYTTEQLDVEARPDLMARIAADTGGAALASDEAGSLGEKFREHLARSRPERVRRITAWDRWWILLGVFVVWSAAWGLRRSSGLV
jgi:hypothetical protein